MKATINGIQVGYEPVSSIGFISNINEFAMYLFDGAIGQEVTFKSEDSSHRGAIVRINGKPHGSNDAVTYVSVADSEETWTNDEGDVVPVTYSLRINEFDFINQLASI